jgi:hypothetical protein
MQILKDGKYPTISLEIEGQHLQGTIRYGAWNAIAVELTNPIPGGCVRWKIYEPCDGEWLGDESGQFTEYGSRFAAELLISLYNDAMRMGKRLDDIKQAMSVVAAEEGVMAAATQSFAIRVFEALPGAELDVDPATFCSTYQRWLSAGLFDSSEVVVSMRERVSNLVASGDDASPENATLTELRSIVSDLPDDYWFREKYAFALVAAGEKDAARGQAERLANEARDCHPAHFNLGLAFWLADDPRRARHHFEESIRFAESDSQRQDSYRQIEALERQYRAS